MKNTQSPTVSATTTTDNKNANELRDILQVSMAAAPSYKRGTYNEILVATLSLELKAAIQELVQQASRAGHVDEHSSWDFGVEYLPRRGECSALNWDAYGIGYDCHTGQLLAVVQVRQFHRKKAGYWPSIRKNYFLLGRNEDATVFAHSVQSKVVHSAIRKGDDVVKKVQDWIFGGDYAGMLRQGDLAMIPCTKRPAAPKLARKVMVLEGSHRLKANAIRQSGAIYAKHPHLVHIPGTHPDIHGGNRWFKIVVGKRANFWKFAAPTVD